MGLRKRSCARGGRMMMLKRWSMKTSYAKASEYESSRDKVNVLESREMSKKKKLQDLSGHLFWDVDFQNIDVQKHQSMIIERVITRGNLKDLKILFQLYPPAIIKREIVKAGSLDKKSLNWVSSYFNIPKTMFTCYSKIQSRQVHWNF